MKRLLTAVAVIAFAVTGAAASATAAAPAYPPGTVTLTLSAGTVTINATFTATLRGCEPGETVRFSVGNVSVEATCSAAAGFTGVGAARATLKAPSEPGTYTVTGEGLKSHVKASAKLKVVAGGRLPSTGSDSSAALWIGGSALVAGLGLTGVAWRRRRPANA